MLADAAVVVLVSAGYVVAEALSVPKRWTFAAAGAVLVAFGISLVLRRTDRLRDLGFRADNLRAAAVPIAGFTLVAASMIVDAGLVVHGRPPRSADVLTLLAIYPAWALIQQFAFQGILHRRLAALTGRPLLAIAVTSVCFAAVHAGSVVLVAITLPAGMVWSVLFRRWPNLWLLAASHTVLAALAYPLLVEDAPLRRL